MVFYMIGLGLGDKEDITLKGLNAIKSSKYVFIEYYTSILSYTNIDELSKFYNKKLIIADRNMVEQNSDKILNYAMDSSINVSFLVIGDPLCATTHTDLLLRSAKDKNIKTIIIHNASIMNAVSVCGLQLYHFGQTISIPFWTDNWKPTSFYNKIKQNKSIGLHTLCLLDIKVKEISEDNLIKGINKYDKPTFMTVNIAIKQLLEIEKNQNDKILGNDVYCIGMARIGHDTQQIIYDKMITLLDVDFGDPLHCLVIPGKNKLHDIELDVLKYYNNIYRNNNNSKDKNNKFVFENNSMDDIKENNDNDSNDDDNFEFNMPSLFSKPKQSNNNINMDDNKLFD